MSQTMNEGTSNPTSVNSSAPLSDAAAQVDRRPPSPAPQPAQSQRPPMTTPQRSGGGGNLIQTHPVWTALIALVVIAVAVGVGFAAGHGTTNTADVQQSTINTISVTDPSVVQIQGRAPGGRGGVGSGEILTSSGYIVTNSHVVHGLTTLTVLLSTGQTVSAQLIGDVPSQDLAVIKILREQPTTHPCRRFQPGAGGPV